MLRRLSKGERSVGELAKPFRMSLAAASKHVKVLERAGLVRRTVRGRTHHCRLEAARLAEAQRWIAFINASGTSGSTRSIGCWSLEVSMKITLTSVLVDDQAKALDFYVGVLGFVKKMDMELPARRTLADRRFSGDLDGVQLLLEPDQHPAAGPFKRALFEDGIPATSFEVEDIQKEYERLTGRSGLRSKPTNAGPATIAVLEDTCGNLIQIHQVAAGS
jgi:DNA-binding transcriptional ArsR family regulator